MGPRQGCQGHAGIDLCSKCYFMEDEGTQKAKMSSKGVSKCQNQFTWARYEASLNGAVDRPTNRRFRMVKGTIWA